MNDKTKIGLALGSGSMKGLAHIGVLKVLLREKIPVHLVAGSSIGALIGALFCCGTNWDILEKFVYQLRKSHLIDLTVPKKGLIEGRKIHDMLKLITQAKNFSDLAIPLAVTATDLEKGELVVIKEGSVADAVRASISIPGIFKPVKWQSRTLVDGAVLERVPVSVVREMGADIVLAVDVKGKKNDSPVQINNIFEVIVHAIDLLNDKAFYDSCAGAEVVIMPELPNVGLFNLELAEETIKAGETAALNQVAMIKALLAGKVVCHN
jgi:NTE family protein